ncbi:MAG: hypothetical protein ACR2QE_18965 [Acidimicrobiales bacterium]
MKLDHLTIHHQDGDQLFELVSGGYRVLDGRLAVSVETRNLVVEASPRVALLSIVDHPVDECLVVGDTFEAAGPPQHWQRDGTPTAFAYFEFHATDVVVRWTVTALGEGWVVLDLEAEHDDIWYYNAKAKRTRTTGRFRLATVSAGDLWVPG